MTTRSPYRRIRLVPMFVAVLGCHSAKESVEPPSTRPVQFTNGKVSEAQVGSEAYTEYTEGTLPIVLVATHDGDLHPQHIPTRENVRQLERFSTARDRYTAPLIVEVADDIERLTGKRPHVVINRLSRRVMDPNRNADSAYECEHGAHAYEAFHEQVARALEQAGAATRPVLLVDVHGQTAHPADICLSTHGGSTLRNLSGRDDGNALWPQVEVGRQMVAAGFSVPGLVHQMQTDWVGKQRESQVRTISIPPEPPWGMQQGGWLIREYSRSQNNVSCLQVEVHRRIRYQSAVRRRCAAALAASLERFLIQYLRVASH